MVRVVEKSNEETLRRKIVIHGAVQGVGFRPFVYRIARECSLCGWVSNSSQGVIIEIEGTASQIERFLVKLHSEKPPLASIQSCEITNLDSKGYTDFVIKESESGSEISAIVLPDIAICDECRNEIFKPTNRRYLYPFTNCTNCGPRYSIITALPYDRKHTTMQKFTMCEECEKEYHDPANRRFHAQPNACPNCGPKVELWDYNGSKLFEKHTAIEQAVQYILDGKIVAVKGLGGFHLVCDARNEQAVQLLRERKHREEKPFAVMFPNTDAIETECALTGNEKQLLLSPQSPIVLLKKKLGKTKSELASSIAPNNPFLGVMIPYTPLHAILLSLAKIPIVATSGNISDEPICTDEFQAVKKLYGIADYFLIHNRPIERYCDDSIVRFVHNREFVLRRARGYAPLPVYCNTKIEKTILAVGAHLKNAIAVGFGSSIFISQHIGDLETVESFTAFEKTISHFQKLYKSTPEVIVHDKHPNYFSTSYAQKLQSKNQKKSIQHHVAHVFSCMAENELTDEVLGFSWDGTGYGDDGTIWGGEAIVVKNGDYKRVATIRPFKLIGGDAAAKEARRCTLAALYEIYGDKCFEQYSVLEKQFTANEKKTFLEMLNKNLHTPVTTSMGRLFDAVAGLLNIRARNSFEGQSAMELEFMAHRSNTNGFYSFTISEKNTLLYFDWGNMFLQIIQDCESHISQETIVRKFHNTLTQFILEIAQKIGMSKILLTGGCFQNVLLLENTISTLQSNGFFPYWHQHVPANDGGISLGQIYSQLILK